MGYDQTIFNATWISPLPEFFISSTKYYRKMRPVNIRIVSIPLSRSNSDTAVGRRKLLSLYQLCKSTTTWKMYKILNGIGENIFNMIFIDQCTSKHISLRTNILCPCKMRCDLNNLHGVHVIPWRCLSKALPIIRTVLKISSFCFNRPKTDN